VSIGNSGGGRFLKGILMELNNSRFDHKILFYGQLIMNGIVIAFRIFFDFFVKK
jgi:hypothetical protein